VERLDAVLRISNPAGDIPFAELDSLYRHVLGSVHNIKGYLRILGAILEELLSLNRGDVSFILGDLHSIINVPDTRRNSVGAWNPRTLDTGIRILHSSLIDFLTDRSRAGRYFINSVKVHPELARVCSRNLLSGKRLNFWKLFNTDSDIISRSQIHPPIRWTGACDTLQIFRANSRATDKKCRFLGRDSEIMTLLGSSRETREYIMRAGIIFVTLRGRGPYRFFLE